MDDKHIYSTSFWDRLKDKSLSVIKEISNTANSLKPKAKEVKTVLPKTEPVKKILKQTSTSINKTQTIKPKEKIKPIKIKYSRKFTNENSLNILAITLGIAIVFIFGFGILISFRESLYPLETKRAKVLTPTIMEQRWTTYSREDLGYSLSYPANFLFDTNEPNGILIGSQPEFMYIVVITPQIKDERAFNYFPEDYEGLMNLKIGETVNSRFFEGGTRIQDISIDNFSARQFISESHPNSEIPENIIDKRIYLEKDQKIYLIGGYLGSNFSNELFNKILSTFKFIDDKGRFKTFCGGIAGIVCPEGFTCSYDGNYPDAGGTCIKD